MEKNKFIDGSITFDGGERRKKFRGYFSIKIFINIVFYRKSQGNL